MCRSVFSSRRVKGPGRDKVSPLVGSKGGLQLDFCEMVCDLRGKYKRNKIFVHTARQSANHARAFQVDSELFGCPSVNY